MSSGSSSSGLGGILALIACVIVFFLAHKFFPSLGKILVIALIVIAVIIVAIVVLVIVFTKSTEKDKKASGLSDEDAAILKKGRSNLMELKRSILAVKNKEIRAESEEICKCVDKILRTLNEQPEDISGVRQFFNYYLPTFGKILSKYHMLEKNGIPAKDVTDNTIKCLADIKTAMEKQHKNLFDDDLLDLSVEMEALKINCKRDGLLAEEDFVVGDKNVSLTL